MWKKFHMQQFLVTGMLEENTHTKVNNDTTVHILLVIFLLYETHIHIYRYVYRLHALISERWDCAILGAFMCVALLIQKA